MPKPIAIRDFARKLDIVTKRLNWSRTRLAQAVAVDKSVVARWAKGSSQPTANSLMQLNQAITGSMPAFNAADWDLPAEQFARRIGLDGAAAGAAGAPSGLAAALPQSMAEFAAHFATWAPAYDGFYRTYFRATRNDGWIYQRAFRLWPEGGVLRYETRGHHWPVYGQAIAGLEHLYLIGEQGHSSAPMFVTFNGNLDPPPKLLTGIGITRGFLRERSIIALPLVLEFVARRIGDAAADAATWAALVAEDRDIGPEQDAGALLPRKVLRHLDLHRAEADEAGNDSILVVRAAED
jgi:transcriptional regulator with XRE-family HTH domain